MSTSLKFDEFEWNGRKCTEFGVHALNQPVYTRAKSRLSSVTIPGRSGALSVLEGEDVFDPLVFSATCVIDDASRVDEIAAFFRGRGEARFYSMPEGYYKNCWIVNQIPFAKIVRGNPHRSFSLEFQCLDPFFYLDSGDEPLVRPENYYLTFNNPGNIFSNPKINLVILAQNNDTHAYGVMIKDSAGNIISETTFSGIPSTEPSYPVRENLMFYQVEIDSELKMAYNPFTKSSYSGYMSGDWPKFPQGRGTIYTTYDGRIFVPSKCYMELYDPVEEMDRPSLIPRWRRI